MLFACDIWATPTMHYSVIQPAAALRYIYINRYGIYDIFKSSWVVKLKAFISKRYSPVRASYMYDIKPNNSAHYGSHRTLYNAPICPYLYVVFLIKTHRDHIKVFTCIKHNKNSITLMCCSMFPESIGYWRSG